MKNTILIVTIFLSADFLFTACTGNNSKAGNRASGKR